MSATKKYIPRYTYADYAAWEGDWELWDGVPISISPSPFGRHQKMARRIDGIFQRAIEAAQCDVEVIYELDWIVDESTVLRPDNMIVCGRVPDGHLRVAPGLVCEVLSDSTRQRDLGPKRDLYERFEVPAYLAIDPQSLQTWAWQLSGDGYQVIDCSEPFELSFCDHCQIAIDPAAIATD